MSKCDNGIKNQVLLTTMLFLSCLIFSNCSRTQPEENNKSENPFGSSTNKAGNISTQILRPCRWSYTVEQHSNGEATLISTAKLDSGWHLYSQHLSDKVSTKFAYADLPNYELVGETEEGRPEKEYNPYLEMEVLYFEKAAVFKQKIKVLSNTDFTVNGTIDYMVCLTQCVLSDEEFYFNVKGNPQSE
jgi:thiol:disulfide interchange protein DsbD